jgi:hypothetical protein
MVPVVAGCRRNPLNVGIIEIDLNQLLFVLINRIAIELPVDLFNLYQKCFTQKFHKYIDLYFNFRSTGENTTYCATRKTL